MQDERKTKAQLIHELRSLRDQAQRLSANLQGDADPAARSEARFRKIFDHSNDAIFVIDPFEDIIHDCNPKACAMLGYSRDELLSLSVSAVHPQEMPALQAFARAVFDKGSGWTNELTCLTKNGSRLPSEISASVLHLGDKTALLAFVRDITLRKDAEKQLRKMHDELERRVQDRTAELTRANQKLKQQIAERRQVEQALRAVTEGTLAVTGGDFFRSLVQHLASTLQTSVVFVTECTDVAKTRVRTLAFVKSGELKENIEYDVAGTACEKVIQGELCVYPEKLEELYPKEEGFQSYVGVPLLDSAGELIGHLAILDDKPMLKTTYYSSILEIFAARAGVELERKRAEEALQESEERFRSGFKNASIGMAMTATDGYFISVNKALCRMLGYSEEALLAKRFQEITFPDDLEKSVVNFQKVKQGEIDCSQIEKRYVHSQGDTLWAITTASVVRDLEGKPWYLFAQIQDITERKRAEQALQRYTKRLETLQEIDRAILAARSLEEIAGAALQRIQQLAPCQRATVVLFDFELHETLNIATHARGKTKLGAGGRFPLDAFEGIDELRQGKSRIVNDIQNHVGTEIVERLRAEGIRSFISVPLMVKNKLLGAFNLGSQHPEAFSEEEVQIAREVTDSLAIAIQQARLHDQVQRHAAELEERVAERTAELESFAYSISHDLRTPLLAIDGFAQLLAEDYLGRLDAEGQRYLRTICDNSKNMGQLIDDLLVFYRIGNQKMLPTKIDMTSLARQAIDRLATMQTKRKPQFKLKRLPAAFGDQAMIRQVLVNLFSNAVKFTTVKEKAVIEVGSEVKNGETVFYIKDNGVGFDMQYADKLFGVFQRLHSEEQFEGTGVGLALVQRIIQRHGGRIWAEGRVDDGATFYFTLPQKEN